MWQERELAYLAGIVDGEGSITITVSRQPRFGYITRRHRLLFQVSNCDRRLMDWLVLTFGGNTSLTAADRKGRRGWHWTSKQSSAGAILTDLLPYLKLKRRQAEVALAFLAGWKARGGTRVSDEQLRHRDDHAKEIQSLNRARGQALIGKQNNSIWQH